MNARHSDPQTSHDAAEFLVFAASQHQQILECLDAVGELGAEQIAHHIGIQAYQVRKRLPELFRAGLVAVTDKVRTASTGKEERIWRITGATR